MNIADIAIGVLGGGALGAVEDQARKNERGQLAFEQERAAQLLDQRELIKARAQERLRQVEHQYKLEEKGIDFENDTNKEKIKYENDVKLKGIEQSGSMGLENNRQAGRMALEKLRTEGDLSVAKVRGKDNEIDSSKQVEAQTKLRKMYNDLKTEDILNEMPDFETWAIDNYPEAYNQSFGRNTGQLPEPTEIKGHGGLSGFDFSGISSRVKKGANSQ